jgi:hypothetical protein
VNLRRSFVPYVLLGLLTLGAGLGVGLGLSEGPVTYTASLGDPMNTPCSAAPNGEGLSCQLRPGTVSFLFGGPGLSKGAMNCLVDGLDGAGAGARTPPSFREIRRVIGLLLPGGERGSKVPIVPFAIRRGGASA